MPFIYKQHNKPSVKIESEKISEYMHTNKRKDRNWVFEDLQSELELFSKVKSKYSKDIETIRNKSFIFMKENYKLLNINDDILKNKDKCAVALGFARCYTDPLLVEFEKVIGYFDVPQQIFQNAIDNFESVKKLGLGITKQTLIECIKYYNIQLEDAKKEQRQTTKIHNFIKGQTKKEDSTRCYQKVVRQDGFLAENELDNI